MPVEIKDGSEVNGHKFHVDPSNPNVFRCVRCGMTDSRWNEGWHGCPNRPHEPQPLPKQGSQTPLYPGGVLPVIPAAE